MSLHLPGLLGDLDRAGFTLQALKLAANWGGEKHYIPANPQGSRLAGMIGDDAAALLCQSHGGCTVDIPRAAHRHSLKRAISQAEGGTSAVARQFGCTQRWVREVRNSGKGKADPRQMTIFDVL